MAGSAAGPCANRGRSGGIAARKRCDLRRMFGRRAGALCRRSYMSVRTNELVRDIAARSALARRAFSHRRSG